MMNNMNMMNDMELDMVAGGGYVSGSWDDACDIHIHGGGVSGGWGPAETIPEPEVPTNVVEQETEVIIVVVENHYKPRKQKRARSKR